MNDITTTTAGAVVRNIDVITAEIQFYKNQAGEAILEIGHRLIEAKEQLQHGEWLNWLQDSVEFSEATAQRFMRIAREYTNPSPVTDLGIAKAVVLLALPPEDREEFLEENPVESMSKRELEQAVREKREALEAKAAAEAQAEKQRLELEAAENLAAEAEAEAQRAKAEKEELERELEQLRNKELELAPEQDQQTLEIIRKQAAAEAKKEAEEKLRAKIEKAAAGKAAAETDLQQAKTELERVKAIHEKEQADLAGKVKKLESQLIAANSTTMTVFKTHFDGVQISINKMLGLIREESDGEIRGKLTAAMAALCRTVLESEEITNEQ